MPAIFEEDHHIQTSETPLEGGDNRARGSHYELAAMASRRFQWNKPRRVCDRAIALLRYYFDFGADRRGETGDNRIRNTATTVVPPLLNAWTAYETLLTTYPRKV